MYLKKPGISEHWSFQNKPMPLPEPALEGKWACFVAPGEASSMRGVLCEIAEKRRSNGRQEDSSGSRGTLFISVLTWSD